MTRLNAARVVCDPCHQHLGGRLRIWGNRCILRYERVSAQNG